MCGRSHERGVRGNPALYPLLREEFDPHIERRPVDPQATGGAGSEPLWASYPVRCHTQALLFGRVELAYAGRRPAERKADTDAL
jgi:hypothetical protein